MIQKTTKPPEVDIQQVEIVELITSTHGGAVQIQRVLYHDCEFILKSVLRDSIETEEQLTHLFNEREALWCLNHRSLNKAVGTAKDAKYLHFLLELVEGLTLDKVMQMYQTYSPKLIKLIIYQVSLALQYMHSVGFIYRDLKANNIFLDSRGRVTIVDFGFAKRIDNELTDSFCGTLHAMAPEILNSQSYGYQVDHYALGILLYELIARKPPFGYLGTELRGLIVEGITNGQLSLIDDPIARDLITGLLKKDAKYRLGRQGFGEILGHSFFQQCKDFEKVFSEDPLNLEDLGISQEMQDDIETFGLRRQRQNGPLSIQQDLFDDIFG